MFALYKLQAKAYFANIFARADFITTAIFLLVLGSLISLGYQDSAFGIEDPGLSQANIAIISSITILMVMNSALYSFGFSFFEMKKSVLLKRIGATQISKVEAVGSFLLWGFTTMLFTVAWIALWVGIMQIHAIAEWTGGILYVSGDLWRNVNWLGVVVAIMVTAIAFYAISFFFVSICSNSEMYNILTTFYFFIAAFLGGSFTPSAGRDWMTYIGYMSPLGWASEMMSHAMLGGQVFHLGGYEIVSQGIIPQTIEVDSLHAVGHMAFPLLYGTAAGIASIKFFRWDS